MAALAPLALFATLCADVPRQRRCHGLAASGHAEQPHVSGAGLPYEQQQNYGATWPDTHQIERALLFTARLAVTRHPVGCCVLSSGWCVLRTELPMAVAVAACQRAVSPRQPIATGCAPNMGAEIGQCPCGEI